METVTDGDLMEAICHCCPGGKNVSFVDCSLHVSRRHLLYRRNTWRGFFISFLPFIYDLHKISCVVQKYYKLLTIACKEENKNKNIIEKLRKRFMESAIHDIIKIAELTQITVWFV